MIDDLPLLIVFSFAAFRLAMLVTEDTIFEPLRRVVNKDARPRTPRAWLGNLITCPYCMGVWMSFAVTFLYGWRVNWPGLARYVIASFAVAGGQVIITEVSHYLKKRA